MNRMKRIGRMPFESIISVSTDRTLHIKNFSKQFVLGVLILFVLQLYGVRLVPNSSSVSLILRYLPVGLSFAAVFMIFEDLIRVNYESHALKIGICWSLLFVLLAIIALPCYYLSISVFIVVKVLLSIFALGMIIRKLSWRVSEFEIARMQKSELVFLVSMIILLVLLTIFADRVGTRIDYGFDQVDYAAYTRSMMRTGQFFLKDLGLSYPVANVDATPTMLQGLVACISSISGQDLVIVYRFYNTILSPIVLLLCFGLFRSIGFSRLLSIIMAFFAIFFEVANLDWRQLAFNRPHGFMIPLVAFISLIAAFKSSENRNKYLLVSSIVAASVSLVHPSAFVSAFIPWCMVLGILVIFNEMKFSDPLSTANIKACTMAVWPVIIVICLFFLLNFPKFHSLASHTEVITKADKLLQWGDPLLLWCIGLSLIMYFVSIILQLNAFDVKFKRFAIPFFLGISGSYIGQAIFPFLIDVPYRVMWEMRMFTMPFIFTLTIITAGLFINSIGRLRIIALIVSLFLIPIYFSTSYQFGRNSIRFFKTTALKRYQVDGAKFLKRHKSVIEFFSKSSPVKWPRVAGNPNVTRIFEAASNIVPASKGVFDSPSLSELSEIGLVGSLESLHLADAKSEREVLIWSKRLKPDYVMLSNPRAGTVSCGVCSGGYGLDDQGRYSFWAIRGKPLLVASDPEFRVFKAPQTNYQGITWSKYNSRLFRFRFLNPRADLEGPVLMEARCGEEVLAFDRDFSSWEKNFAYINDDYIDWPKVELNLPDGSSIRGRRPSTSGFWVRIYPFHNSYPFRFSSHKPSGDFEITLFDDKPCPFAIEVWMGHEWHQVLVNRSSVTNKVLTLRAQIPTDGYTEDAAYFPELVTYASPVNYANEALMIQGPQFTPGHELARALADKTNREYAESEATGPVSIVLDLQRVVSAEWLEFTIFHSEPFDEDPYKWADYAWYVSEDNWNWTTVFDMQCRGEREAMHISEKTVSYKLWDKGPFRYVRLDLRSARNPDRFMLRNLAIFSRSQPPHP